MCWCPGTGAQEHGGRHGQRHGGRHDVEHWQVQPEQKEWSTSGWLSEGLRIFRPAGLSSFVEGDLIALEETVLPKFSSHSSLYHQSPLIGSKQVHWFVHSFHNVNVQWKFTVLFFLYYSSSFGPGVLDDKHNLSVRILLSFDCLKFLKFAFKGWSVGIDWLLLFKGKCVKGQSWFGLIFLHFLISVWQVKLSYKGIKKLLNAFKCKVK